MMEPLDVCVPSKPLISLIMTDSKSPLFSSGIATCPIGEVPPSTSNHPVGPMKMGSGM